MKYKCTCMVCNWSEEYSRTKVDGLNCPECGGPVLTNPVERELLAFEVKPKQMMKYMCLECRLIYYDTGQKDDLTCLCGGMLEPLGWVRRWIGRTGKTIYSNQTRDKRKGKTMFKETFHSKEALLKVTDALDMLRKDYTVVKESGTADSLEVDECGIPRPPKPDAIVYP